jgi:hypothetical protein
MTGTNTNKSTNIRKNRNHFQAYLLGQEEVVWWKNWRSTEISWHWSFNLPLTCWRSEYVKLQQKCNILERENALLAAQAGGVRTQDSFVGRLLATVSALYNRPLYSDLTILTPASSLYAHKFVLRLRFLLNIFELAAVVFPFGLKFRTPPPPHMFSGKL